MQRPQLDLSELKHYQVFSGNGFLPPKNYIQNLATPDLTILLLEYFWPEFISFDGCYFRKSQFDTNLQSYSNRVVFHIASIMQQTWESALKMQYPELGFKVEVFSEEDLVDPQVTFQLVR